MHSGTPLSDVIPALSSWRRQRLESSTADSWRYRVDWTPITPTPTSTGQRLLVLPPTDELDDTTRTWLNDAQQAIGPAASLSVPTGTSRNDLALQLTNLQHGTTIHRNRVPTRHRRTTDPQIPTLPTGLATTVLLVQALGDAGIDALLWAVTRSVTTGYAEPLTHPDQAQVWGLGRVVALEHPYRWGGLIDLPPAPTSAEWSLLPGWCSRRMVRTRSPSAGRPSTGAA